MIGSIRADEQNVAEMTTVFVNMSPNDFEREFSTRYPNFPKVYSSSGLPEKLSWSDVARVIVEYNDDSSSPKFRKTFTDVPVEFICDKLIENFWKFSEQSPSSYRLHYLLNRIVNFVFVLRVNKRAFVAAELILQSGFGADFTEDNSKMFKNLVKRFRKELPEDVVLNC